MLNNHHTLPVPTLVLRKSTLCLPLLNHTATLRADTIKGTVPILLREGSIDIFGGPLA